MSTILAVSPHLDDAVFSLGGYLADRVASGDRVVVATVFTGSVVAPTGFALACQLDKGLAADVDYMALRRAEDMAACAILGATCVHLPLLEAPHRGYDDAAALFDARLPADDAVEAVTSALTALIATIDPDRVLGPAGVGNHVDHHVVREALDRAVPPRATAYWHDWPYAVRARLADGAQHDRLALSVHGRATKLAACAAYTTQIAFQFGSVSGLRDAVLGHDEILSEADAHRRTTRHASSLSRR